MTIWRRYLAAPTSGDGTPLFYPDLSEWNDTEDLVRLNARTTPYITATNAQDLAQGDEAAVGRKVILVRSYVLPDVLTDRILTGRFRFVGMWGGNNFGTSAPAYPQAVVKVITPTGATRGLLATVGSTNAVTTTAYSTRRLDAALTPVTAQAGDRLVVELGADAGLSSGTNSGVTLRAGGELPANGADLPFADGVTTPGVPWFEIELDDPPPAPANLRQTGATETTIDVAWDHGGTPPEWYEYRLDGGAGVLLEDATTVTLTGLTAGTDYLLEVRAARGWLTSAWVPLVVSTIDPPPVVGLRLEVGEGAEAVDLLGDAYTITIRRGNATRGVTDTIEAATLVAVIDGPKANPLTVSQVRPGALVRVLVGTGGAWEPLYTGKLDRARVVYDDGPDKADPDAYRVTVTVTDPITPVLAGTPHETAVAGSLAQRVAHVLDPTGLAYAVEDPSPTTPAPALATKERTAGGNLRLVVDTAHAIAYVDRAGVLRVVSDHARPRTPEAAAADYLATDDPAAGEDALHYYDLTPSLDTDAIVNVLEVELGGASSTHIDEASRAEWGPHADKVTVNDGLPETHADLWLASRREAALRPEALSFNVGNPYDPRRPAHLAAAAVLEPYDTISVERAGVFATPVKMTVRDITHTITASNRHGVRWLCHLGLRPLELLATRWDDVPPTLRWSDLEPTMTWDDAVRWHPYL